MQRVSRLRFIIIATIACAILFCIAAFSVSFAKWTLGDDSNATAVSKGNAANFYVEYPQYVSGSGENEIVVPPLDDGDASKGRPAKYYLQVPQRGNTGTADFYEFKTHDTANEVKLQSVYLYPGDVLSLFCGKAYRGITTSGAGQNLSDDVITFGSGKYTVQSQGEGFYDFYYNYSTGNMWTVFVGKPSENNGNNNNEENTIDTTGYTELFSVKFSDDAQVKRLFFKTGTGATAPYNSLDNFAVHIRDRNWRAYYYNYNVYPGSSASSTDGNMRYVRSSRVSNALEGQTLEVGTKADTVIVFGFDQSHLNGGSTTAAGNGTAKAALDLSDYAVGEINLISLHTATGGTPRLRTSGAGSGSNDADERTAIAPDYEGTTDFHNGLGGQVQTPSGKKTVRKVTGGAQGEGNKYVYNNYICVSRKNSAATDDDNTIAYLEFEVSDSSINPYDIKVTSLTLRRRATDSNGNIKDRFVDPAPRIYNYDPNLDTRLGPDTSSNNLSDPNISNRKPLFAHGLTHAANNDEGAGHMKAHFDDGIYVVLYFGDNDQQYFAMDIEIELELAAGVTAPDDGFDFTLKAQAANSNSWERYEDGYGEPWGYYMGGLINSVETWDPSRTTKLERASDRYKTDYDPSYESQVISDIENATDEQINAFNERDDFNYKLIRFYTMGALEGYARYPEGKIDVSLTVNLTEGSLIKMYMVDHDGHRINGHTVYVVPSEIVYDAETKKLFRDDTYDIYDKELNIIIPKTGTYIFRLVGHFHTRDEEVVDTNGNILKGDKICFDDGKRYEEIPVGKNGMGLPNFNLWVDTLYITCSNAGAGNSECTVTLDANGGTFDEADLKDGDTITQITRIVTFGSDIKNLPQPTYGDKDLLGWYYEDENGNTFDFDFGSPVTGNMLLKAKWAVKYWITFNANGGTLPTLPSGVTNPIQTDEYGNLTKAQWDAFKPTYTGYNFLGWFTAQTGGNKLGTETTFTADREVFAHWEQATMYTVTFDYNGMPSMTTVTQQVAENDKAKQPTEELLPANYHVSGWYTNSGCTVAYDFNTAVTSTSTKTLYAKWYAEDGIYVNNVRAGGLINNPTNATQEVMATDFEVTVENAVVSVWYGKSNGKLKKDNIFGAEGATDISLSKGMYNFYLKHAGTNQGLWIDGYYVITLDANGGTLGGAATVNTEAIEKSVGVFVAKVGEDDLPSDPTNTGYRFDGWYTAATGGTAVDLATYAFTGNTTVYAHWVQQYTVTLNANGGKWGNIEEHSHQVDINTKIADSIVADKPTRASHTFLGWFTAETGGEEFDLSTTAITEDITLYAHWEESASTTYTVTFNSQSGSAVTSQTVEEGEKASKPTDPTRSGYKFTGWYTDSACSYNKEYDFDKEVTENITLYARWIPSAGSQTSSYYVVGDDIGWAANVDNYLGQISGYNGSFVKATFTATSNRNFRIVDTNNSGSLTWTEAYGFDQVVVGQNLGTKGNQNNITLNSAGTYIIVFTASRKIEIYEASSIGGGGEESTCNAPTPTSDQIVIKVTGWSNQSNVEMWLWMNGTSTYDYFGNVWGSKPSMNKDADGCWYYVVTRNATTDVATNLRVIFVGSSQTDTISVNVAWGNTFTYAA